VYIDCVDNCTHFKAYISILIGLLCVEGLLYSCSYLIIDRLRDRKAIRGDEQRAK
jgi:hypothetical protein